MTTEETELTFIRCPGCRSLVPAIATRCRMCGELLEQSAADKAPEKAAERGAERGMEKPQQKMALVGSGAVSEEEREISREDSGDAMNRKSRVRQRTMSVSEDEVESVREQIIGAKVEPTETEEPSVGLGGGFRFGRRENQASKSPSMTSADAAEFAARNVVKPAPFETAADDPESNAGWEDDETHDGAADFDGESEDGEEEVSSGGEFSSSAAFPGQEPGTSRKRRRRRKKKRHGAGGLESQSPGGQFVGGHGASGHGPAGHSATGHGATGHGAGPSSGSLSTGSQHGGRSEDTRGNFQHQHGQHQHGQSRREEVMHEVARRTEESRENVGDVASPDRPGTAFVMPNTRAQIAEEGGLMGWFIHYGQDANGAATEIRTGRYFVGKENIKKSDLVLGDGSVSTPHCLIQASALKGLKVQDLMSEHGTYVRRRNQDRFYQYTEPVTVGHGDWLRFGSYEVLVCLIATK